MKKISVFTLLTASSLSVLAKSQSVEMADGLRGSGMIYVVVSVMSVILAGVLIFLFSIDKKLTKLEKNCNE
ncbi:MAG: CcmD family protein [Sphingobacteriaceae bacterium]|nr:CcmD family protein [Sphingobacteriaceae bacterium]